MIVAGGLLFCGLGLTGAPAFSDGLDCVPLTPAAQRPVVPPGHRHGLLWRISRLGAARGFLFGTIHLGDPELVDLPEPVLEALSSSPNFVMEARLDAEDVANWSRSMLDTDTAALRSNLGGPLFERAVALLAHYHLPPPIASRLKPWAVFLTLSTPPDSGGLPLDLVLAGRAADAGKSISGLESAAEQADVVAQLPMLEQVALVRDAVCHYATLQADVETTKQLYRDRDLAGLVSAAQRYALSESPRYRHLMEQMLWQRNLRMVERINPHLARGGVFIAVGALHLPGARGLLGLLEARGYTIAAVY